MVFDSVSEPCSVRWPLASNSSPRTLDFPRLLAGDEPDGLCKLRRTLYERCWLRYETIIENASKGLHSCILREIAAFVMNAHQKGVDQAILPFKEIPAALAFVGVNVTDHSLFYQNLINCLRRLDGVNQLCYIAVLRSPVCTSLKATMKSMIDQLLRAHDQLYNNSSANAPDTNNKPSKLATYDLYTLHLWYQHITCERPKPSLVVIIEEYETFDTTLLSDVIMMMSEYIEGLPFTFIFGAATSMEAVHQGLTKLVLSKLRMAKFKVEQPGECLDIVFRNLFLHQHTGIRFGAKVIDLLLARFSYSNLSISEFKRAFKYALMDFYYGNPLSVLCSYDDQSEDNNDSLTIAISALTSHHIHLIRCMSSFRTYIEQQFQQAINQYSDTVPRERETLTFEEMQSLLVDDDAVKRHINDWLTDLHTYHVRYNTALLCLYYLQNQSKLSKRSLRYLYSLALDHNIMEDEHIKLMMLLLKKLSKDMISQSVPLKDALTIAEGLRKQLNSSDTIAVHHEAERATLGAFCGTLQLLIGEAGSDEESDSDIGNDNELTDPNDSMATRLRDTYYNTLMKGVGRESTVQSSPLFNNNHQLHKERTTPRSQTMSTDLNAVNRKRALNILESETIAKSSSLRKTSTSQRVATESSLRLMKGSQKKGSILRLEVRTHNAITQFIEWLNRYLTQALQPYTTQLLHELLYYDKSHTLQKVLTPQPRNAVQSALSHPHLYLSHTTLSSALNPDAISPTLPDTCILYRLYLECGRLINLYDWFQAFQCIVDDNTPTEIGSEAKAVPVPGKHATSSSPRKKAKKTIDQNDSDGKRDSDLTVQTRDGNSLDSGLLARFIRSIAELQFLGFTKPTMRKTDHVQRLTWGQI